MKITNTHPLSPLAVVRCNGSVLRACFAADEESGWADAYVLDTEGNATCSAGHLITQRHRGDIEVSFADKISRVSAEAGLHWLTRLGIGTLKPLPGGKAHTPSQAWLSVLTAVAEKRAELQRVRVSEDPVAQRFLEHLLENFTATQVYRYLELALAQEPAPVLVN